MVLFLAYLDVGLGHSIVGTFEVELDESHYSWNGKAQREFCNNLNITLIRIS